MFYSAFDDLSKPWLGHEFGRRQDLLAFYAREARSTTTFDRIRRNPEAAVTRHAVPIRYRIADVEGIFQSVLNGTFCAVYSAYLLCEAPFGSSVWRKHFWKHFW